MFAAERVGRAARPLATALAVALACLTAGCASDPIPQAQRPTEEDAITSGFGSFIYVVDSSGEPHAGELIDVLPGRLSIFDGGRIEMLPRERVTSALLLVHRTHENAYTLWTVLGTLSTVTHGFFLVFSAPIWISTGVATAISEHRRARLTYPDPARWEDLRPYARFPQGLPPGITGNELLHGRMFAE
ncbi:MAG TPA: hypothetical protein VFH68_19765 [Polyangia bacterium]|jgi:hypothetical protein|nr:hypothetical protein [Polyangia bacterium]